MAEDKKSNQEKILEKLNEISAYTQLNTSELQTQNNILRNKKIEFNESRGVTSTIFIALYCASIIIVVLGISLHYNFNNYIALGISSLVIITFIHLSYLGNR